MMAWSLNPQAPPVGGDEGRGFTIGTHYVITPATMHPKVVIPAKAGIQNELDWMPDQVRHDIVYV